KPSGISLLRHAQAKQNSSCPGEAVGHLLTPSSPASSASAGGSPIGHSDSVARQQRIPAADPEIDYSALVILDLIPLYKIARIQSFPKDRHPVIPWTIV